MGIIQTIEKYLNSIIKDEFHRFKSWDNCHQVFSDAVQSETHILELAFYLASWGMYRGSGGLLFKNHLIHKGAVEILFSKEILELKCNQGNEVDRNDILMIIGLKNKLADYYSEIYFTKDAEKPKPISPTDTLLSKILLGTLGCVPAYDRYFIDGLKEMKMKHFAFNFISLTELFDFIDKNKIEIEIAQKNILIQTNKYYPIMKIIDMYFWQIGYDKNVKDKK